MAVNHKNYLSIPTVRRRATASKSLAQLRDSLGNPVLTEEQRANVLERINRINQWAAGTLPTNDHRVEIAEDVNVDDGS